MVWFWNRGFIDCSIECIMFMLVHEYSLSPPPEGQGLFDFLLCLWYNVDIRVENKTRRD